MQSAPAVMPAAPAAAPAGPPAVAAPPAAGPARPQIPDVQGLVVLIRNAILGLHQANVAGDYSVLRELAAPDFQQANSPANLSNVFADLRGRDIDLGAVTVVNPSLASEPVVTDQGLMRLVGFFPAGGQRIDFDLVFQPVGGRWELISIGVFPPRAEAIPPPRPAKPTAKPTVPDPAGLVALIRQSVMALGQANMAGDYAILRGIASPGFRDGNSLVKLAKVFADLRGRNLDLGPVAVIEPHLFKPAEIDKQGFLRLTGYFPSRPEQVNFDLAFQFIDGDWRLFGIGLNTSREVPQGAAGINQASGFTAPAK
jgi:hypothetical protein